MWGLGPGSLPLTSSSDASCAYLSLRAAALVLGEQSSTKLEGQSVYHGTSVQDIGRLLNLLPHMVLQPE